LRNDRKLTNLVGWVIQLGQSKIRSLLKFPILAFAKIHELTYLVGDIICLVNFLLNKTLSDLYKVDEKNMIRDVKIGTENLALQFDRAGKMFLYFNPG
jgi:hypothetical protein